MVVFIIKEIRERKNMSLYRLSKYSGISYSYLSEIENNKKDNPSMAVISQIADALEVDVKDLFYSSKDLVLLKSQMYEAIEKYGLTSPETLNISKKVDFIIFFIMRNQNPT